MTSLHGQINEYKVNYIRWSDLQKEVLSTCIYRVVDSENVTWKLITIQLFVVVKLSEIRPILTQRDVSPLAAFPWVVDPGCMYIVTGRFWMLTNGGS